MIIEEDTGALNAIYSSIEIGKQFQVSAFFHVSNQATGRTGTEDEELRMSHEISQNSCLYPGILTCFWPRGLS